MYDYELEEERMEREDEELEYKRYISQVHCVGCDCVIDEDDNLTEGLCDDCVDELMNFDDAMEIGEHCKYVIEINGFLAAQFDEGQIEEILTRELKESHMSDKRHDEVDMYYAEAERFYNLDKSQYLEKALELELI